MNEQISHIVRQMFNKDKSQKKMTQITEDDVGLEALCQQT